MLLTKNFANYQVEPRFWNEVDQWRKNLERPRSFRKYHGVVADQIVRLETQAAVAAAAAVVEGGYAQRAMVMRRQTTQKHIGTTLDFQNSAGQRADFVGGFVGGSG